MAKIIFSEQEKQNIIKQYTIDKISAKNIGKQYNTSAPTILKNLREWNIPINTKTPNYLRHHSGEHNILDNRSKFLYTYLLESLNILSFTSPSGLHSGQAPIQGFHHSVPPRLRPFP